MNDFKEKYDEPFRRLYLFMKKSYNAETLEDWIEVSREMRTFKTNFESKIGVIIFNELEKEYLLRLEK